MNVYDFDNTIYDGDSSINFYAFCLRRHPSLIERLPKQMIAALRYKTKKIDKVQFKEIYFSFLERLPDFQEEVEAFWNKEEKKIKKWYLVQQKESDIIISASPYFLLEEICKRLNIKHLIASRVNPLSGRFEGPNCYGLEKVRQYDENFAGEKIDVFYSDSLSDQPMADLAAQAFIVKKDKAFKWPERKKED